MDFEALNIDQRDELLLGEAAGWDNLLQQLLVSSQARATPVDEDAKRFLDQLRARDKAFIQGLLVNKPDIIALEQSSLAINARDEERLRAGMYALSALDFLSLAEKMKTLAKSMPFIGKPSSALRTDLLEIVKQARTLPLNDPPGAEQIEELPGLLGQS